jgi:CO/xanthine dehydrogenase Mo-binding subunit
MTSKFVRTEAEFEGRVTEVWTLVDDDDELPPWPESAGLDVVGRPAQRHDGPLRAAGAAQYTVDVQLPGMLHAAVLRSPIAHAQVTGLQLDAARRVGGVRAVIGPNAPLPCTPVVPLLTAAPKYSGQAIALVAADTPAQAQLALKELSLEFQALAHVVDPVEAVSNMRLAEEPREESRGDVEAAFAGADTTIEFELETPDHLQTPFEAHAAVARWDEDDLTVWLSTQGMFNARRQLANVFALPESRVRVLCEFIGGGFGGKQDAGWEAIAAAVLARVTGRPVRLVNDRHAEHLVGGRRARAKHNVRLAANRDGRLLAVESLTIVDQGQGGLIHLPRVMLTLPMSMYECDNVGAMVFLAGTNRAGQNAFRAPGMMEATTAFEQAIDELALAIDLDPLELRRINHADHDVVSGRPYSSKHLSACFDRAAKLAGWEAREQLRAPQLDGLLRGMGCAAHICWGAGAPPAHVTIRIDAAGRAWVATGIQDIGTGTLTAAQLVAAEELGLPLEHVQVVGGDTGLNLFGPVAGGSTTVPSVLPAVRVAAQKARELLLSLANDVLGVPACELQLRQGRLRSLSSTVDLPVTDVTQRLGRGTIEASGSRMPNAGDVKVQSFGCQIAQVAVDPAVGEVRVERIVAVHDVGRIINPLGASSQVEGGVLQGMAFAMSEELVIDPTTGTPVNAYLDDYKLPTIIDTPEIIVDFIDIADDAVPAIGARGLGEPPIIPTPAAIANAFAHATGRRCRALPMTRARVLEALA